MLLSKNTCVISRENNVILVDFTHKPEPPDPRFPGRMPCETMPEEVQLRLALAIWRTVFCPIEERKRNLFYLIGTPSLLARV